MDFEKAFSDFIDNNKYDKVQEDIFELTRAAFIAGWKAAQSNKIIEINPKAE